MSLFGCSGDVVSMPIMVGYGAWQRGYMGIVSGLTKSTGHPGHSPRP